MLRQRLSRQPVRDLPARFPPKRNPIFSGMSCHCSGGSAVTGERATGRFRGEVDFGFRCSVTTSRWTTSHSPRRPRPRTDCGSIVARRTTVSFCGSRRCAPITKAARDSKRARGKSDSSRGGSKPEHPEKQNRVNCDHSSSSPPRSSSANRDGTANSRSSPSGRTVRART